MIYHRLLFLALLGFFLSFNVLKAEDYLFFSPEMRSLHLNGYSDEEKLLIDKDLQVVRSICFGNILKEENEKPFYIATAGAPGSRKSTILEKFLQNHVEYSNAAYLDPDQRALKLMSHTFYSRSLSAFAVSQDPEYSVIQQKAYEKWRGASNYITTTLIEEAFKERLDIVHGTTSTGAHIVDFYTAMKEADYKIILILCSCDDRIRRESITYRNNTQHFYQSSPEDAVSKGKVFPQKIGHYFTLADELYFFWSEELFSNEKLAAYYKEGHLEIIDPEAYDAFIKKYEYDREMLQKEGILLPPWEGVIEKESHKNNF